MTLSCGPVIRIAGSTPDGIRLWRYRCACGKDLGSVLECNDRDATQEHLRESLQVIHDDWLPPEPTESESTES